MRVFSPNTGDETLSHWVFIKKTAVSFTCKGWVATQLSEIFWVTNLKVIQGEGEMSKAKSQLVIYKEKTMVVSRCFIDHEEPMGIVFVQDVFVKLP